MIAKISKVVLQRLNGIQTKLRVYQNPSKLKYKSEETTEEISIWIKNLQTIDEKATKPAEELKNFNILLQFSKDVQQKLIQSNVKVGGELIDQDTKSLVLAGDSDSLKKVATAFNDLAQKYENLVFSLADLNQSSPANKPQNEKNAGYQLPQDDYEDRLDNDDVENSFLHKNNQVSLISKNNSLPENKINQSIQQNQFQQKAQSVKPSFESPFQDSKQIKVLPPRVPLKQQEQKQVKKSFQEIKKMQENLQKRVYESIASQIAQDNEMKQVFEIIKQRDKYQTGTISAIQLSFILNEIYGNLLNRQQVDQLIDELSQEDKQEVNYTKFVDVIAQIKMQANQERLRQAFDQFDKDNNGKITQQELSQALSFQNNDQMMNQLINDVDQNGDGTINFQEFENYVSQIALFSLGQSPSQFYRNENLDRSPQMSLQAIKIQKYVESIGNEISQMILPDFESSLELLLVALQQSLLLQSKNQAAAFLTNNNRFLRLGCMNGLKGGEFKPLENWMMCLQVNSLQLAKMLAQNPEQMTNIIKVLSCGFYAPRNISNYQKQFSQDKLIESLEKQKKRSLLERTVDLVLSLIKTLSRWSKGNVPHNILHPTQVKVKSSDISLLKSFILNLIIDPQVNNQEKAAQSPQRVTKKSPTKGYTSPLRKKNDPNDEQNIENFEIGELILSKEKLIYLVCMLYKDDLNQLVLNIHSNHTKVWKHIFVAVVQNSCWFSQPYIMQSWLKGGLLGTLPNRVQNDRLIYSPELESQISVFKTVLTDVLDQFGHEQIDPRDQEVNTEIIATTWFLFPQLFSESTNAQSNNQSFLDDFLLSNNDTSQFLNYGQNKKSIVSKRANSPGLLGNQVIDFAVRALSKSCRSQNKAVSLFCIQMCFSLLNGLAASRNPHSAAIYKMMTFNFIENFQDDITREVMSQSFSGILRRHQSIPLNVFVEPFLRKIIQIFEIQPQSQNNQKISESTSYFQFFDELLLSEIISHSKFLRVSNDDQIPLIIQLIETFLTCLNETRQPFYIIGIKSILNKVLEFNSDHLQSQVAESEKIMKLSENTIEEISKTQIQAWSDNETVLEKVMLVKKIKIVLDFMVLISVIFNNSGKLVGTRFKNMVVEQSDKFEEIKTKLLGKNRQNLKKLTIAPTYFEKEPRKLNNKKLASNIVINESENASEKASQNQRVGGDVNRAQVMAMKIRAQAHIQRIKEEKDNKQREQQQEQQQKKEKEDRLREVLNKNRKGSLFQPALLDQEDEYAVVPYQKLAVQKQKSSIDTRQLLTQNVEIIDLEEEELNETEGVRLMIQQNYKLIKSIFLKYAVNGAVANSLRVKKDSLNLGQKSGKNAYEDMIGERMINMREIYRFVKECCGFSDIQRTDIQYIVKYVNKAAGINDVLNMTLQQFSGEGPNNKGGFLLQLAYHVFGTDPTKCMESLLRVIVLISEQGNTLSFNPFTPIEKDSHKIYQKDQKELSQLSEQQRQEIFELEKKVKGGANTYVLPSQYVSTKELYCVKHYKIPMGLRRYLPEKQIIVLELLDEILSQATGAHFIEPLVFFKQHIKVRPRVAHHKAYVASAGAGQKRQASLTKLNSQDIKSQDVQKQHRRALSANKEQPIQFQAHLKHNFSTNADSVSLKKRIEQFAEQIDNDPLYSNGHNDTSNLSQKRQKKSKGPIKSLLPPKPIQGPKLEDLQEKLNQAEEELKIIQNQRPPELNPDLFVPHIQKELLNQGTLNGGNDNHNPYQTQPRNHSTSIRNNAIADQLEKEAIEKVYKIEEEIRFLQRKEESKIFKEIKQRKKDIRDHSKEINEKQQNEGLLKKQYDELKSAHRVLEMEQKKKLVEERLKKKEEERLQKLEEETAEKARQKEEKAQSQKEFLDKQKQILQQQFQNFKQKKDQIEQEKQQKEKADNKQGEQLKEQVMRFHKIHKQSLQQKQEKDEEIFSRLLNDQYSAQVLDQHKLELIPIYKATAIQNKNFQLGADLPLKTKIEVQLKEGQQEQNKMMRQDSVAKKQKQLELLPNMNVNEFSKLMMQRGLVNSSKKTMNKKDLVEVFNFVKNEDELDIDYFCFETALLRLFLIWQSKFDNFQPKANNKIISDHSDRVAHTVSSYQKNASMLFTDFDQFLHKFEKKALGGYAQQFAQQSQDKEKVNDDLVWIKEKQERDVKQFLKQQDENQKEQHELQELQQKLQTDPFLALSLGISSPERKTTVKNFKFNKEQKQQSPNIKGAADWLEKKNTIVSRNSPNQRLDKSQKSNNSQSVQNLLKSSFKKQSPFSNSIQQIQLNNQLSPSKNSQTQISPQKNQIQNNQSINQSINALNSPQRNYPQNINNTQRSQVQNSPSPQRGQNQMNPQQNIIPGKNTNKLQNQQQFVQQNLASPQRNLNQQANQQNIISTGKNTNQPQYLQNQNLQQNFNQQLAQQNFQSPQRNLNQTGTQQNLNSSTRNLNQLQNYNSSKQIANSGSLKSLSPQKGQSKNQSPQKTRQSGSIDLGNKNDSSIQSNGQYKSPYTQKKKFIKDDRPIYEKINEKLGDLGNFKSNQEAYDAIAANTKSPPQKQWGQNSPKKEEDSKRKTSPNAKTVQRNNPPGILEDQEISPQLSSQKLNNLAQQTQKSNALVQGIGSNLQKSYGNGLQQVIGQNLQQANGQNFGKSSVPQGSPQRFAQNNQQQNFAQQSPLPQGSPQKFAQNQNQTPIQQNKQLRK